VRETPKTFRCVGIIGLIFLLAVFGSCAGLPDYALPRSGAMMADSTILDEAFTYRQLTRSDFRAPALPPDQGAHASAINAHTCARIRPTKDSRFSVVRTRYNDSALYIGGIEKIRFEGIMIPGCSWWNPALPAGRHAYVLQHEQVHFALVELAARRLTVDIREEARSFMSVQSTEKAARTEIAATVNRWIRSAMEASLEMHTAFDNDTSLFHSPRWQQWWQDKIEKQLAADAEPTVEK